MSIMLTSVSLKQYPLGVTVCSGLPVVANSILTRFMALSTKLSEVILCHVHVVRNCFSLPATDGTHNELFS